MGEHTIGCACSADDRAPPPTTHQLPPPGVGGVARHASNPDNALTEDVLRLARAGSVVRNDEPVATRVVILAGGRGRRLEPYTSVLPKPLMPIGNRSILEIVVHQLDGRRLPNLTFCVGYLSHLIRAVFENGAKRNATITWVKEHDRSARPGRCVSSRGSTRRSS